MSARAAAMPLREPAPNRKLLPNSVLAMLLFVFTEVMLFAGMISAHAIVKAGAQEWPPFEQPRLPLAATFVNTIALLLSGATLVVAHVAWRRWPTLARGPMLMSVLLGGFFVAFQGREWLALVREGLTLTSSPYGSFFYLIVGTHAVHAVAAIGALAWAWMRLRTGRLSRAQFGAVEVFWYFVVLVWPVLYWQVYL